MSTLFTIESEFLLWVQSWRQGRLNKIICPITHLADGGAMWIAVALLLLIVGYVRMKKGRGTDMLRVGAMCAAAMLLTLLVVNVLIKPLAARTRPYDAIDGLVSLVGRESDFSFPSGHSANSFSCAWAIFRSTKKKYGIPALILAALISLSRLYVGVHYPSDVICGVIIGIAMSEIGVRIVKKLFAKKIDRVR